MIFDSFFKAIDMRISPVSLTIFRSLAMCFFLAATHVFAETTATVSVTPIPFVESHSFVLIDQQTQCRYIGRVEKSATLKIEQQAKHSAWVMDVKEKWCRPKEFQPERSEDFQRVILDLPQPLKTGDRIILP